jgi:hypothetical protein
VSTVYCQTSWSTRPGISALATTPRFGFGSSCEAKSRSLATTRTCEGNAALCARRTGCIYGTHVLRGKHCVDRGPLRPLHRSSGPCSGLEEIVLSAPGFENCGFAHFKNEHRVGFVVFEEEPNSMTHRFLFSPISLWPMRQVPCFRVRTIVAPAVPFLQACNRR